MKNEALYISIGPACRPAHHLVRHELRKESHPLDWQMGYSLDTVIHLFETEYTDFFEEIEESSKRSGEGNNRRVTDTRNHIISIHHFSKDQSLKEAQEFFRAKMQQSSERLLGKLKHTQKIVLLGDRQEPMEELQLFLQKFSRIYPEAEILLINIRDDKSLINDEFYEEKVVVSDKLTIMEYKFNDSVNYETGENFSWKGNIQKWDKILGE